MLRRFSILDGGGRDAKVYTYRIPSFDFYFFFLKKFITLTG